MLLKRSIVLLWLFLISFEVRIHEPDYRTPQVTAEMLEQMELNVFTLKIAMAYYDIQCPDIVLRQAILETGHFKSYQCKVHNNLFGLYDSRNKRYFRFDHWSHSVRGYKNMIQNRYKDGEDYYKFLKRIGYAEDPDYIVKLKKLKV
jgi:flagellum-specific peptidoglycan hydrolase FlgJ